MRQRLSLQDLVVGTLAEMGVPAPNPLIHTLVLREARLVAEKFRYDQGCAIWVVGSEAVEFYGQDGKLLKTVAVTLAEKGEAA